MLYQRTFQILEQLIRMDTTSRNSNLEFLTYIQQYLASHSVNCILDYNATKTKANLLATLGPMVPGGIILSGHTDTVPVDGQAWDTDPFTLTKQGEKLYGRGTSDMKSFIALALAMVPEFLQHQLSRPIHLVFSYDEEIGCQGVPSMVQYISSTLPKPEFAIIGEPTGIEVVTAHKGIQCFETTVTGIAAHSSCPHLGASAIVLACDLIDYLHNMVEASGHDHRFTPSHNSFNVGKIQGGTAINIIPDLCRFHWEMRTLPGSSAQKILDQFYGYCRKKQEKSKTLEEKTRIVTTALHSSPALQEDTQLSARRTMMQLASRSDTRYVSFATEAGIFQQAGIPAFVCGPGHIAQAHKPNEYIELSQIESYLALLTRLSHHVSTSKGMV